MFDPRLEQLKYHYLGWKKNQTLNLPMDLNGYADELHRKYNDGTPLPRGCGSCIGRALDNIMRQTGIGTE